MHSNVVLSNRIVIFAPVPSMVDTDTTTNLAMVARGGIVVMVMHTGRIESLSATVIVEGTESTAAKEDNKSHDKISHLVLNEVPSLSTTAMVEVAFPRVKLIPEVTKVNLAVKYSSVSTR